MGWTRDEMAARAVTGLPTPVSIGVPTIGAVALSHASGSPP